MFQTLQVGPKPLIPLLRHMSHLKGAFTPKVSEAAWAERFPPICLVRTAFIGLGAFYNWMQIVTADVAIFLVRLKIFSPLLRHMSQDSSVP
jgi:hypothetical protein